MQGQATERGANARVGSTLRHQPQSHADFPGRARPWHVRHPQTPVFTRMSTRAPCPRCQWLPAGTWGLTVPPRIRSAWGPHFSMPPVLLDFSVEGGPPQTSVSKRPGSSHLCVTHGGRET